MKYNFLICMQAHACTHSISFSFFQICTRGLHLRYDTSHCLSVVYHTPCYNSKMQVDDIHSDIAFESITLLLMI